MGYDRSISDPFSRWLSFFRMMPWIRRLTLDLYNRQLPLQLRLLSRCSNSLLQLLALFLVDSYSKFYRLARAATTRRKRCVNLSMRGAPISNWLQCTPQIRFEWWRRHIRLSTRRCVRSCALPTRRVKYGHWHAAMPLYSTIIWPHGTTRAVQQKPRTSKVLPGFRWV